MKYKHQRLLAICISIICIMVYIFSFSSCATKRNWIKKPLDTLQAKKIIYDLQQQFPVLVKKDSSITTNTTTEEVKKEFEITTNDSLKLLQATIDSMNAIILKGCPEIEPETLIEYRTRLINNCKAEKSIKEFSFDSSGFKGKLYYDKYGNLKLSLSVPKTTIKETKNFNNKDEIKKKEIQNNNYTTWLCILFCIVLLIVIIQFIREYIRIRKENNKRKQK